MTLKSEFFLGCLRAFRSDTKAAKERFLSRFGELDWSEELQKFLAQNDVEVCQDGILRYIASPAMGWHNEER